MTNHVHMPTATATDAPAIRRLAIMRKLTITLLLFVVALVVAVYAFSRPQVDFIEYWTAAHLLVAGKNPYSLLEMFRAQQAVGWQDRIPLMFLSPPWALPFLAPLGLAKSYVLAWLGWVAMLTGAVALSSRLLMDVYFGDLRIPEISDTPFYRCLFAFTFFPVLLCLRFTQTAPLMLLGLAGFLYFESRRRPLLAGALLSLTLIKPQLPYLIWLAVFFWSFQQRRWKTLVSAIAATALFTAVPLLFDPQVLRHYWELATGPYMQAYPSGVTALLRKLLGGNATFWIQFVPPLIGVLWFASYWRKHQQNWIWIERMPMLVTVSVLTSAYGWHFDQTLLVLPVIALAAQRAQEEGRVPWNLVILYTGLNVVLMLLWPFPSLALLPAPILIAILLSSGPRAGEGWVATMFFSHARQSE